MRWRKVFNILIEGAFSIKMASDFEDDEDLASLRNAALASLNVRSNQASPITVNNVQEENSVQAEEDEDDDLDALRLAALKTKKAVVPQPVTPQPRGQSQVPFSEASGNAVRGNNLISIPLLDLSAKETVNKEPDVPEVKKEVRNDKFSRFQSDSESEEEEDEDVESIPEVNPSDSSADEADVSDKSGDESDGHDSKDEESDDSESNESESEKSSDTESSTSESEESSNEDDETIEEPPNNGNENTSEKQNGIVSKTEINPVKNVDPLPPPNLIKSKTIDLRNQLHNKHAERRNVQVERENRYKTHRLTNQATSRGQSGSYEQRDRTSQRDPEKYKSNRDRKGNNVNDRGNERRHNYDRPLRKSDEICKRDNCTLDNKRKNDRKGTATDYNKILDRRKSNKPKENSRTKSDTLKKPDKIEKEESLTTTKVETISDSDSDVDTDSRFKQAKSERTDQIDSAPSRIVTSMQLNQNFEQKFGRNRDFQRDRRKDQDLRFAPRFDNRLENRRNDPYKIDQYYKRDKDQRQKIRGPWEDQKSSSRERSRGREAGQSRKLEFVDDSDEEKHKKGIRSFVHTNDTKKSKTLNESKDKKQKSSEQKKNESEKEKRKPSSKERTEISRIKENRARKSKSESSIKLLKKVKQLDVGNESKTTEVSVTFDSDPEKVLKKSKKSIQERLGKTVSKHKASVKQRLGAKDDLPSDTWDSVENLSRASENNTQQDARKFVSKDGGKSRKSVKERLNLKRTPSEFDVDISTEPSRKIVRASKSDSAVDKMSAEEKLKRRRREKEIQEKIRKIEERNLASSKVSAKINDVDLSKNSKDKELELRISRIKEKNEAILKRQREIEEDKQRYGK